jgi:hypothetical protein
LPRQNRPLVRDGRLQSNKKKRTDRSYLGATAPRVDEPPVEATIDDALPAEAIEQETAETEAAEAAAPQVAEAPPPEQPAAAAPPAVGTPPSEPQPARSGRLPSSVRALQQQGIRRRREFDVDALAERDTRYAYHELRRILILTSMVIVTLIVLGIVLR